MTSSPDEVLSDISERALRDATVELFREAQARIDRGDVDLVVLTARRMPCLYQALVDGGMPPLVGAEVISSHALDMLNGWRWDKVLVLDDNIILGSTLATLTEELRSRGARSWTTRAVCSDESQVAPYLLEAAHASSLVQATSQSVERYSEGVIRALYRRGRPLFSDFPISAEFSTESDLWIQFIGESGWRVAEVTAPLLENYERKALVKVPTRDQQGYLFAGLPQRVADLVEVSKLRCYVTQRDAARVSVRFVPICLMKPCDFDNLDQCLAEVCGLCVHTEVRGWIETLETSAKYRLLQYLASAYMLFRASYLSHIDLGALAFALDRDSLDLSFGASARMVSRLLEVLQERARIHHAPQPTSPLILDRPRPYGLLSKSDIQRLLWRQQELIARANVPAKPGEGEVTKVGLAFSHAVTSIFGYIGERYEKPQRKKLAELANLAEYQDTVGSSSKLRLLNAGFTLQELGELLTLTAAPEDEWSSAAITLALDVGNDLGIVVPITRLDEVRRIAYRCFRLGETSVLASIPLGLGGLEEGQGIEVDAFTRRLYRGYPLHSIVHSIQSLPEVCGGTSPREKPRQRQLKRVLVRFVKAALPGGPEERYSGSILDVHPDRFITARLRTLDGIDAGVMDLRWDAIDPEDVAVIGLDAEIVWTVFSRMEEGNRLVSSRVHVLPEWEPAPDTAELVSQQLFEIIGDG